MARSSKVVGNRFSIDPKSVAKARAELREIVKGIPVAEAAVAGFSDWQAIEALERLEAAEEMPRESDGTSTSQPEDWLAVLFQQ
jgi:hypothetical protein